MSVLVAGFPTPAVLCTIPFSPGMALLFEAGKPRNFSMVAAIEGQCRGGTDIARSSLLPSALGRSPGFSHRRGGTAGNERSVP